LIAVLIVLSVVLFAACRCDDRSDSISLGALIRSSADARASISLICSNPGLARRGGEAEIINKAYGQRHGDGRPSAAGVDSRAPASYRRWTTIADASGILDAFTRQFPEANIRLQNVDSRGADWDRPVDITAQPSGPL